MFAEQIKRSQSEKGGDRLQSLISKYRGHSDAGSSVPERKIKPLSLSPSNKMGLVTKGRSFGPAAAKGEKEVSEDESVDTAHVLNFHEQDPYNALSEVSKIDAFNKQASPVVEVSIASEIEAAVAAERAAEKLREVQEAERLKSGGDVSEHTDGDDIKGTQRKHGISTGTQAQGQNDIRATDHPDGDGQDKDDGGEDDDDSDADGEESGESDSEQKDIDALIDR